MDKKTTELNQGLKDNDENKLFFDEFIKEFGEQDAYKFYLYKWEHGKFATLHSCDSEFLNKNEIARTWKSGKYKVLINYYDPTTKKDTSKTEIFRVHSEYKDPNAEAETSKNDRTIDSNAGVLAAISNMNNSFSKGLQVMQESTNKLMMNMIMMVTQNNNNQNNQNQQTSNFDSFAMMNQVMNSMMHSNLENNMQMQKQILESQQPQEKSELVELLEPLVKLIPGMLAMPMSQKKKKKFVNDAMSPEVKELMKNPKEMQAAEEFLKQEIGEEKTNKILETIQ